VVSIIIPTYNRCGSLALALAALSQQTFPADCCQVIVVDDGSTESIPLLDPRQYPFPLCLIRQENTGATAARNTGAQASAGEFLLFLDDDIDLVPAAMEVLAAALLANPKTVALGLIEPAGMGVFARVMAGNGRTLCRLSYSIPPSECLTGILAVRRIDFFSLGMFQDPTGGWPNWDDVDFGYRAYQQGFRLLRCPDAAGLHRDHSLDSFKASCQRTARAACSAVALIKRHPGLYAYLPMFHDKTPLSLKDDSPGLVLHKLFHASTALPPLRWGLESLTSFLERAAPKPRLLQPLYRWINSIYIYRGFQEGLKTYGSLEKPG
jgi:glycosyltransferase involved in cell wall biosynthesis